MTTSQSISVTQLIPLLRPTHHTTTPPLKMVKAAAVAVLALCLVAAAQAQNRE
jgi:hypothetical protein